MTEPEYEDVDEPAEQIAEPKTSLMEYTNYRLRVKLPPHVAEHIERVWETRFANNTVNISGAVTTGDLTKERPFFDIQIQIAEVQIVKPAVGLDGTAGFVTANDVLEQHKKDKENGSKNQESP